MPAVGPLSPHSSSPTTRRPCGAVGRPHPVTRSAEQTHRKPDIWPCAIGASGTSASRNVDSGSYLLGIDQAAIQPHSTHVCRQYTCIRAGSMGDVNGAAHPAVAAIRIGRRLRGIGLCGDLRAMGQRLSLRSKTARYAAKVGAARCATIALTVTCEVPGHTRPVVIGTCLPLAGR